MSDPQAENPPGSAHGANSDSTPTVSMNVDSMARLVTFLEIPDDVLPVSFGRFELREVLGQGAFGKVYRAYDKQMDREVAVKIPRRGALEMSDQLSRFLREARLGGKLHHPNICPIHDVGEFQGNHYIVMELIEGTPLSQLVNSEKPMDPGTAARIVLSLTAALAEAHDYGIVHRDLKPSNIMLDEKRRRPVILDFGLARSFVLKAYETPSGLMLGTPLYMSPEQLREGAGEVGPQSDVYSLGVILYELIAGWPPFSGSVPEVFAQILTFEPKQPSWYQPQLDSAICSISLKAMAREATQRYKSMRDFGAALRGYLQGTSPTSSSGSGASAVAAHVVPRVPTTPPLPTAQAPTPEKIDFACPKCGLLVQAPRATAGKKGRCPNCGAIFPLEALGDAADATSPRDVIPSADVPTQRFAPPQRIEFSCPHCHNLVRTPPGSACKKGRCPWCQRVVKIPRNDRERMHSSGDDFERLLQRMERSSIVTISQLVGCSVDEIKVLEERYGFRLPRSYVRYLRVMGHRSGRLFTRDHMAVSYSYVLKMTADLRRKWAACSSADDGRPPATFQLPTDALLITSRLKEQFEFIRCNGQDDSPVWYFNDGEWEVRQSHSSVLGWLECWCAEAERVITD